jgi:hypothetical protein
MRVNFGMLLALAGIVTGCGARSAIDFGDAPDAAVACETDSDCEGADLCLRSSCEDGTCTAPDPVLCEDEDPCTVDSCEPDSGECRFEAWDVDGDGDGRLAPRPGFAPGAPDACGDDCDDENAAVGPGFPEGCDGFDNDCNGVIDDGAEYTPAAPAPLRVSSEAAESSTRGGLAFNGTDYGLTFSSEEQLRRSFFAAIDAKGSLSRAASPIVNVNAETYAGPLLYNGTLFATVWSDARQDGNYEIYMNRLDGQGRKLGPDVRLSDAADYSLHPALAYTEDEFLVVWDDRRPLPGGSATSIGVIGQRVGEDGVPVGPNLLLSRAEMAAEYASIAVGSSRAGVVFTVLEGDRALLVFRSFGPTLSDPGDFVTLPPENPQSPQIDFNVDRFIVTWSVYDAGPGPAIFGMALDENGAALTPVRELTFGARFARSHAILPLGDRLLLIWADDHDGNYELYAKVLTPDLNEQEPRFRITTTASVTLSPAAALGPGGDVGILFDDWQSGSRQTYFTRLECRSGAF